MKKSALSAHLVRTARAQAGMTQRALARRASTAQSVVARIERGQTSPTVETLERLLRAAGFELTASAEVRPVLDRSMLDDVPRILRLSPEDRLREIANMNTLFSQARRA
jgi:transcriptional regulator with XRE-family HTH domain